MNTKKGIEGVVMAGAEDGGVSESYLPKNHSETPPFSFGLLNAITAMIKRSNYLVRA